MVLLSLDDRSGGGEEGQRSYAGTSDPARVFIDQPSPNVEHDCGGAIASVRIDVGGPSPIFAAASATMQNDHHR